MAAETHEEFSRDDQVETVSNKRFGLVVGGILLVIGSVRAALHGEVSPFSGGLIAVGLLLMIAALIKPDLLETANRLWNKLGLLLHRITNPIFLGLIYAGAIVPTGLLMRAFGVDPMGMRRPQSESYWIVRDTKSSTPQSIEKPF